MRRLLLMIAVGLIGAACAGKHEPTIEPDAAPEEGVAIELDVDRQMLIFPREVRPDFLICDHAGRCMSLAELRRIVKGRESVQP